MRVPVPPTSNSGTQSVDPDDDLAILEGLLLPLEVFGPSTAVVVHPGLDKEE